MTAYLGAGVYEELLFRLLLLPLLAWVLRRFRVAPAASMAGAVVLSSLLFAAAHYIGPTAIASPPSTSSFGRSSFGRWRGCSSPCCSCIAGLALRPGPMPAMTSWWDWRNSQRRRVSRWW